MRRVFAVIAGIMSLIAGIIVFIMGSMNMIFSGDPFGHVRVFYTPRFTGDIFDVLELANFFHT